MTGNAREICSTFAVLSIAMTFATSVSAQTVADCSQSFDIDPGKSFETSNQSVSCALYEQSRQDLFFKSGFADKLDAIDVKIQRVKDMADEAKKDLRREQREELDAQFEQAIKTLEAVEETADSVNDCLRAIQAAKKGNAREVLRKFAECVDEIDEAGDAVGDAIDAMADEDTREALREASENLIARLGELKKEFAAARREHEAKRDEFMKMCRVVVDHCLRDGSPQIILH